MTELDFLGLHIVLVDHIESDAAEVGTHIVEVALAAIEEIGGVAFVAEHTADIGPVLEVASFDKTLAGRRRNGERQCLETADRTVTVGEHTVERHGARIERVEHGRQVFGIAETRHIIAAHALHGHQDDVGMAFGGISRHHAAVAVGAAVEVLHQPLGLVVRQAGVELLVVERVLEESVEETVRAIGLQLVVVHIVGMLPACREGQETERQSGARDIDAGDTQLPSALIERVALLDDATEQPPGGQARYQHHAQDQRHHGIGFHDVAHNLVGIYQIIDGDEVVAHGELVPEEVLAGSVHVHYGYVDEEDRGEPAAGPSAAHARNEQTQGEGDDPVQKHP